MITESEYDSQTGRLSEQRFFDNLTNYDGGAGTPVAMWMFTYDAFGRQIKVEQEAGVSVRVATTAYDAEGRVTSISSPEGEMHYEYDVQGRRTRVYTGPTADPVNNTRYTYDALSRLETVEVYERNDVQLGQPEITRYRYDLAGNLDRQDQANGVIVDYVYDDLNRLDLLTHFAPDATPEDLADNDKLAEFDYTVREDGRRIAATETFWLDGVAKENHLTWTYDDASRLIDEVFDSYDNALDRTESFVYDLVGNRLRQDVDLGNDSDVDERIDYVYDANDRLQTESFDNGADGSVERTTAYDYLGTTQTTKEVTDGANLTSRATYGYDAQGRMATATIETFDSSGVSTRREVTSYEYDSSGIRVAADHQIDSNGDGGFEAATRTEYLNDPSNHTGYSQVIQETTTDPSTGEIQKRIVYTLGHDVISQSTTEYAVGVPGSPVTLTFGYDGHGSTRVLFDLAGAISTIAGIQQVFHYNAFGNLLNLAATQAATSLLYSGESFDSRVGLQFLRARWYDPNSGRFTGSDPFFGKLNDPQSMHRYLYTHADPVNGTDPSGQYIYFAELGKAVERAYREYYRVTHLANVVTYGVSLPALPGVILPDVADFTLGKIGEIKPLSPYGFTTGEIQVRAAVAFANGLSYTYRGVTYRVRPVPNGRGGPWRPSTWEPGVRILFPGIYDARFAGRIAVTVANVDGILLYTTFKLPDFKFGYSAALAYAVEAALIPILEPLQEQVRRFGARALDGGMELGSVGKLRSSGFSDISE